VEIGEEPVIYGKIRSKAAVNETTGGDLTPGEVTWRMSMAHQAGLDGGTTQPTCSLLLVDDDVELCELLQEFFAQRGIGLEAAHDGRRGLARALSGDHDLLLLDVMMPGLDGFELLRLLRRRSQVPVIMLTARTTQADRVAGLDAGADDYLPKPFGTAELLARIRAVLRRSGRAPVEAEVLEVGGVKLIPSAREALSDGCAVPLTTVEYDILEFLVHAAGRVVSRDELTAALYRRRTTRFDRSLDMHICNVRKKLGARGDLIRTVRGVGYLFRSGPETDEGP
jgi:two-component system, OmpR family, response regulator CpxR